MIYQDHLEESLKKYCSDRKIPIINGRIPHEFKDEVSNFLSLKQKIDANRTRIAEEEDRIKINRGDIFRALGDRSDFESPIEEFMYNGLVKNFIGGFRLQYEIGKYRADIAFPKQKVIVECDGREYHHDNRRQIENDQKRDKYLSRLGWRIVHIEGLAIRRNIDLCVKKVKEALGIWEEVHA